MAILQKYNWNFDFETDKLNIPIDDTIFKKYDIDAHEYALAFIAVALGQIYDPKKVTYKYELNGFYLDVYIEQAPRKWGILVIKSPDQYTDSHLEILRNICHTFGIILFFLYMYPALGGIGPYTAADGNVYVDLPVDEKLEELDFKTKRMLEEVFGRLFPSQQEQFEGIYNEIDTQLCYRLGVLLSIVPKKPVKKKEHAWVQQN